MSTVTKAVGDWVNGLDPTVRGVVLAGGATVAGWVLARKIFNTGAPRDTPLTKNYKPGVVYLYQFPRSYVMPNLSPYCLKLETWLRMADIAYRVAEVASPWTVRSREGMLPFIELDGVEYVDSALCMRDLTRLKHKEAMTEHLSAAERGLLHAVDKLTEEAALKSYACIRYTEKFDELFSDKHIPMHTIPWSLQVFYVLMRPFMLHGMKKNFRIMGIGKHSRADVIALGEADMRALSDILADKPYFGGAAPTHADATVFAFTANLLCLQLGVEHEQYLRDHCANLVQHFERVKAAYWPDWREVTTDLKMNTAKMADA